MAQMSGGNNQSLLHRTFLSTAMVVCALVASSAMAQNIVPVQSTGMLLTSASASPMLISDVSSPTVAPNTLTVSTSDTSALPEAPSAILRASTVDFDGQTPSSGNGLEVSRFTKYVPVGATAPQITAHDKVVMGLRDSISPFSILGILASASYSHLTNGQPNFGTNKGAFGQRIGAVAIRDTTENIFSDSVYAPLLHEDPRYYVEGPQYGFFHRVIYAATRPIITRTDSGRSTINAAQILGDASASAISYTYYPQINRNFRDTVATFGGALGGDAFGDFVSEFSHQVLKMFHLSK